MGGDFQYDHRREDLATGANTTDAAHAFRLFDTGKGGWLVHAGIAVGVAGTGVGGAGPCLVVASIFQRGQPTLPTLLKPSQFARSPALGGGVGDFWSWDGNAGYETESTIRIFVRNDTGSTVLWFASWGVEVRL